MEVISVKRERRRPSVLGLGRAELGEGQLVSRSIESPTWPEEEVHPHVMLHDRGRCP